jgi:hypothetical protein
VQVSFIPGGIVGMVSGLWTSGITTAATVAARFTTKRKLQVTNMRLIFLPSAVDEQAIVVPYDQVRDIHKVGKWGDPAIELATKSGESHRFSIVALAGVGFGNREDLIRLIKDQIEKH